MSKSYYYRSGEDKIEGPFASMELVCAKILEDAKECFESSCSCLKSGDNTNWFERVEIFELVATVKPVVKARFKQEEVQP